MIVSVFEDIKHTENPSKVNVDSVLNLIKTGGKKKDDILSLREIYKTDKSEYKKKKTFLPLILFNGYFTKRNKESLQLGSGLAVLDFDGVEDLEALKNNLKNDPYIYAFFLSPSGDGIKALMKIPVVRNDSDFKERFAAIEKRYPTLDKSGKDIPRACFFSYDPNLYVNKGAITFQEKVVEEKRINTKNSYTDYAKVNIALNKIRASVEGEQHNVLLKMSILMGGYIATKKVDENEAIRLLEQEFSSKNPDGHYDYSKTIRDGIAEGKKKPIRELDALEKYEVGKGKCYFSLFDVRAEFEEVYLNGYEKGVELGWQGSKDFLTIKLGTTSYWYGKPFVGKSQVINEVLVNLSRFYGWKHAILSPETGTAAEIYAELSSMYMGKSFHGDFKMNEAEKKEAMDFVEKHFLVIDPSDKGLDVNDVFDQVDAAEREYNVKIHTVLIDPWNELTIDLNSFGGREDKYLEHMLTKLRQNAQSRNRHVMLVNHVRDQVLKNTNRDKSDNQMYYDVPTPRDLAGGQLWYRKGMLMICVDRPVDIKGVPLKDENGIRYEENETHLYIQKAKPKGTSRIGRIKLFYDWRTNRYYEEHPVNGKMYAKVPKEYDKQEQIIKNDEESEEPPF